MMSERWGKSALRADRRRLQRRLLPDAHPRPRGHAAPHLHLRSRDGLGPAQPRRDDRLGASRSSAGCSSSANALVEPLPRRARRAPNPWGGATLEWATTSPPPPHNFDHTPVVDSLTPLWAQRDGPAGDGRPRRSTGARCWSRRSSTPCRSTGRRAPRRRSGRWSPRSRSRSCSSAASSRPGRWSGARSRSASSLTGWFWPTAAAREDRAAAERVDELTAPRETRIVGDLSRPAAQRRRSGAAWSGGATSASC